MKKILMIILDGFGIREEEHGNAVKLANMSFFKKSWEEYPHSVLEASGEYVGLPENQFGNSEVCHQVIGLGHTVKQKITEINDNIRSGNINNNPTFNEMVNKVIKNDSTLHLIGLLSDGGVHSHNKYMKELIPILKAKGIKKIVFHAITDGRDSYSKSSLNYLLEMDKLLRNESVGYIGTICGRYYAMDRDNKWERTYKYYNMINNYEGFKIKNYVVAINNCYKKNITDEFLPPMIVYKDAYIKDNDAVLWLNFRFDRARQILNALSDPLFKEFPTNFKQNVSIYNMFKQDDVANVKNLFELEKDELYPIGKYFSDLNLTQARIAETEKYSHVTYFFNSELSKKFPGVDNYLVPSPKVSTYDEKPIMSAKEVTKKVLNAVDKDYDFILVNYANPDMLGHTGNLNATIEGLEELDKLLEEVVEYANDNFYKVIILSDHGNCDEMIDNEGNKITTHSMSKVPFIILDKNIRLKEKGDLTMVAPTLLTYMDIALTPQMLNSKILIEEE